MYPRIHLKLTLFITLKSRKCIVFLNFTGSFTQAQHTIFIFFYMDMLKSTNKKASCPILVPSVVLQTS